jgi:hypothetical protein
MSKQLTIEEVYKIIDEVEDQSIRNLLRIAYGQLRAEYEFDRGWKEANLPDLIRLDKRVKELEAALKPFADEVQFFWPKALDKHLAAPPQLYLTIGEFRTARKVLDT